MKKLFFIIVVSILSVAAFADGKDSFIKVSTDNKFNNFVGSVEITKHFEFTTDKNVNGGTYSEMMRVTQIGFSHALRGDENYIALKDPTRPSTYWNHRYDFDSIAFALRYYFGGRDYVEVEGDLEELNLLREVDYFPIGNKNYLDAIVSIVVAKEDFLPILATQVDALPAGKAKAGPMYKWGVDSVFETVSVYYANQYDWEITTLDLNTADSNLKKLSQQDIDAAMSFTSEQILTQAKRERLKKFCYDCMKNERSREAVRILSAYLAGIGVKDQRQQDLVASFVCGITEYKLLNSNWRKELETRSHQVVSMAKKNNKDKNPFDLYIGAGFDAYASKVESGSTFSADPRLKAGFGLNFNAFKLYLTGYAGVPVINNEFSGLKWRGEASMDIIPVTWLTLSADAYYTSDKAIAAQFIPMFNIGNWLSIGVGGSVDIKPEFDWSLVSEIYFFDTIGAQVDYDVMDNTFTLGAILKF